MEKNQTATAQTTAENAHIRVKGLQSVIQSNNEKRWRHKSDEVNFIFF